MSRVIAYVPYFPGTNCHKETMHLLKQVGVDPQLILLNRLISGEERLHECDLLVFAGGIGNGDHIAAGRIAGNDLRTRFSDQLDLIVQREIPVLGICNGYQLLMECGLLPGTLDHNVCATFQHWKNTIVVLHHDPEFDCVWTRGLDGLAIRMPVAHAEGRPVLPDDDSYAIMATYGTYRGESKFPISPNGSPIAGTCTKYIAGLMPHPERNREEAYVLFEAGVNAVRG